MIAKIIKVALVLLLFLTIRVQISPHEPNTIWLYANYTDSPTIVITYALP